MTISESAPRSSGAIIGENITLLLFRNKMTQRDLAHRAGMTAATLSRKMHGERQWSIDELVQVAAALGVSAVELLPRLDMSRRTAPAEAGGWAPWGSNPQPTDWEDSRPCPVVDLASYRAARAIDWEVA